MGRCATPRRSTISRSCALGRRRAAAAAAGRAEGECARCRTVPVRPFRVGAAREQGGHRARAPGANGPVQRGDPALVGGVRVGARLQEDDDRLGLGRGVPARRPRDPVGGVVQRGGAAPVARPDVRTGADQGPGHPGFVGRRGDVQRRVADVDVVPDLGEPEVTCVGADVDQLRRHQAQRGRRVVGGDRAAERRQQRVRAVIARGTPGRWPGRRPSPPGARCASCARTAPRGIRRCPAATSRRTSVTARRTSRR